MAVESLRATGASEGLRIPPLTGGPSGSARPQRQEAQLEAIRRAFESRAVATRNKVEEEIIGGDPSLADRIASIARSGSIGIEAPSSTPDDVKGPVPASIRSSELINALDRGYSPVRERLSTAAKPVVAAGAVRTGPLFPAPVGSRIDLSL